MSFPKTLAACWAFLACGTALAQPARPAPNPNVILEPVQRIGDSRILFPTDTLAISSDGKTLLAADYTAVGNVLVVDIATRKVRGRLIGHDTYINQFAFAPDSKRAYSGPHPHGAGLATPASSIIQWDLATCKELWRLQANAWDLSADGKRLVTLQNRRGIKDLGQSTPPSYTVTLYDTSSRRPLHEVTVPGTMASVIALSRDGKRIACADAKSKIRILDADNKLKEIRTIQAPQDRKALGPSVGFLAWSPDAHWLAAVSDEDITHGLSERALCLWEAATGKLRWHVSVGKVRITSMAFSPDGKVIATTNGIYAAASGQLLKQPSPHGDSSIAVALYRDGRVPADGARVAPLLRDLWERATGVDVASGSHPDRLQSLALSPDERLLATGEGTGFIRLWSFPEGKEVKRLRAGASGPRPGKHWRFFAPATEVSLHKDSVSNVRFLDSVTATKLLAAARATLKDEWQRAMKKAEAKLPKGAKDSAERRAARSESAGPIEWNLKALEGLKDLSAGLLITEHWSSEIRLWNVRTGAYLEIGDNWYTGQAVTVTADPRLVLGKGGRIYLWPSASFIETEPTRVARLLPVPNASSVVALASFGEPPLLVDLRRRKVLHKFGTLNVTHAALSPKGKMLATYGRKTLPGYNQEDGRIRLYDIASGKEWGQLAKDPPASYGVWFAPDGRSVLVQHQDGMRLWELASRQERALLKANGAAVFTRDGRLLLTLPPYSKHVQVWDLTGRQTVAALDRIPLSPEELRVLWNDLGGADAKKAYAAIWRLASGAEQVVPFLTAKIERMPGLDRRQIPALIADLDAPRFTKRDRAMKALPRFGPWAQAALIAALAKDPPIETKRRLEQLLYRLQSEPFSQEQILALRIVEALEKMNTPAARRLLERLRDGDKPQFSEAAAEALTRQ